jgi:hypothetical protein
LQSACSPPGVCRKRTEVGDRFYSSTASSGLLNRHTNRHTERFRRALTKLLLAVNLL